MHESPSDVAHDASNFIEAVSSLYFCVPGLIVLAADAKVVSRFTPWERRAWYVLIGLFWCEALFSSLAWHKWNVITGFVDRSGAVLSVLGAMAFGVLRCQRVCIGPLCLLFVCLSVATFCLEDVLVQHGWREPWPHFTFRYFIGAACCSSVGAEVVFHSLPEVWVSIAVLAVVTYSHAFVQLHLISTNAEWRWPASASSYAAELGKAFVPVLLCAYLMATLPKRLACRKLDHEGQVMLTSVSEDACTSSSDSGDDLEEAASHAVSYKELAAPKWLLLSRSSQVVEPVAPKLPL